MHLRCDSPPKGRECIAFNCDIIQRPDTSTAEIKRKEKKEKRFIFRKLHREKLCQIKEGAGVGRAAAARQSQIRILSIRHRAQ